MKCTKCGLRDATTEVLVRHNNHVEKMYLCGECAKDYRPEMNFESFDMLNKLINGSPMGLLSNLNNIFDAPTTRALICPDCKTTSEDFLKTGFVGCPRCYEVFEPLIVQAVKKLQQSDRHVGKTPVGMLDTASEEARLKTELQTAIDNGDYYKIGELGDKLKRLVGNKREEN
ncbi:MAG: hypothetical protein J1G01_02150 [Clostridiales bacterium]|nr:hypothetical protein [Clostridiales bacterium]